MPRTYGELRALIEREQLGWVTPSGVADDAELPRPSLGADRDALVPADTSSRVDFNALGPGSNPYLAAHRLRRGLITAEAVRHAFPGQLRNRLGFEEELDSGVSAPPDAGAPPAALDWRNRFGQNWITSTRDQNPCNACWAFAGVALVESMVRIEHAMWTRLSEGDPHDGVGKVCADLGNMGEVSSFFANNGFCDEGSWPWHTDARIYAPTPDRSGRSVRGPAFTNVSVADSKNWRVIQNPVGRF